MQAELQNGIITGYNITYQSLTENDSGFVTAGPNDRQANLTGLKEFVEYNISVVAFTVKGCLLYTSPSPRDRQKSRMPSSA